MNDLLNFGKGAGRLREPRNKERKEKSWLETLWGDEELLTGKRKITPAQVMLLFRNAMALLAAMLFLLSLGSDRYPAIRAAGYLFGAVAYICEIMVMTDCFRIRLPRGELFMPYCFGPLYLIMGVGYLVG